MATLHLSAPWIIYYREVQAMFKHDEHVHVVYDEAENHLKVYVTGPYKAAALTQILPPTKSFGSVSLSITVIPANDCGDNTLPDVKAWSIEDVFETAFDDNAAYESVHCVPSVLMGNPITYVVFSKEVVQYFSDDLGDYYGIHSTLYENIARDIFVELDGVFYCTYPDETGLLSCGSEWP